MKITQSASITLILYGYNLFAGGGFLWVGIRSYLILDAGLSPLNYGIVFKNLNICSYLEFVLTVSPAVYRSGDIQSDKFITSN